MEQKVSQLNGWFAAQIALCRQREQALLADDRADEAAFEKIWANVYDIFRTILDVAVRTGGGDAEAVRRFFARRMQTIPSGWAEAWEKAAQHHDPVRMQQEKIKLDTAAAIKARFADVWEGAE